MKTRTRIETVYTLEEVKEQAVQKNWDINVDYEWWNFVYDDAKTLFELVGFSFPEHPFYFSGFSSQGDGACMARAYYEYKKGALKTVKDYAPQDTELHNIVKSLQDVQRKSFYTGTASIRHSGRYYHERSMTVNTDSEKGTFEEDDFKEIVADLCRWLYKQLENEYDYLTSEEAILETLTANGYDFDEEGDIV